jgi:hypothetical protein
MLTIKITFSELSINASLLMVADDLTIIGKGIFPVKSVAGYDTSHDIKTILERPISHTIIQVQSTSII